MTTGDKRDLIFQAMQMLGNGQIRKNISFLLQKRFCYELIAHNCSGSKLGFVKYFCGVYTAFQVLCY